MQKEKINFIIEINNNLERICCYTIDELNKTLEEISKEFIENTKNDILLNEIKLDEFITYRNEIGILVKGNVKNYIIKQDLLEYLLRINYLHKSIKTVWGEGRENDDINRPFFVKKITVKKYLIEDVFLELKVSINIYNPKGDEEV